MYGPVMCGPVDGVSACMVRKKSSPKASRDNFPFSHLENSHVSILSANWICLYLGMYDDDDDDDDA
jgi:hypothetical protein